MVWWNLNWEELIMKVGQAEAESDATPVDQSEWLLWIITSKERRQTAYKDYFILNFYARILNKSHTYTLSSGSHTAEWAAAGCSQWNRCTHRRMTEERSISSSDTHQSLLILKRPVFGLVLHHCCNILNKTPDPRVLGVRAIRLRPSAITCVRSLAGFSSRALCMRRRLCVCACVHEPDESVAGCRLAAALVWGGLQNTSSLLHAHCGAGSAVTGAYDVEEFYTCKFAFLSLFCVWCFTICMAPLEDSNSIPVWVTGLKCDE